MPISFRELLEMPAPDERYVVESGLVPLGGLVFVGGPPKSYKSFLLLTAALQMSCGLPLFGASVKHAGSTSYRFGVIRPMKVLIVEQELGWIDDRERLKPMWDSLSIKHRELISENLHIEAAPYGMNSLVRLDNEESDRHYLIEAVDKVKPDVLILDPLSMFHRLEENSARDMSLLMRNLAVIRNRFKLKGTIVSHHTSKPREGGINITDAPPDLLRGSSVLFATGDSYIMVSRLAGDRIRLDFTLRRHKPITSMVAAVNEKSSMVEFQEWSHERGGGRPQTEKVQ
jgi:RecA-family ATPase